MLDGITGLKEVKGLTPKYKVVDKYLLRGSIFFIFSMICNAKYPNLIQMVYIKSKVYVNNKK
ncbi:TPA: hypothetical protein CPT80_08380 [Candidatus Gastranaerophilales bacterium HUM_9]|nr:MAG TPA: hypothetical protein CPT80_08380 [Candidatus Gastranaerophilales bacterium HUM_9]HBX35763.1 hypothetical protein [Cyanobacteria bacterium UBA11440]